MKQSMLFNSTRPETIQSSLRLGRLVRLVFGALELNCGLGVVTLSISGRLPGDWDFIEAELFLCQPFPALILHYGILKVCDKAFFLSFFPVGGYGIWSCACRHLEILPDVHFTILHDALISAGQSPVRFRMQGLSLPGG